MARDHSGGRLGARDAHRRQQRRAVAHPSPRPRSHGLADRARHRDRRARRLDRALSQSHRDHQRVAGADADLPQSSQRRRAADRRRAEMDRAGRALRHRRALLCARGRHGHREHRGRHQAEDQSLSPDRCVGHDRQPFRHRQSPCALRDHEREAHAQHDEGGRVDRAQRAQHDVRLRLPARPRRLHARAGPGRADVPRSRGAGSGTRIGVSTR